MKPVPVFLTRCLILYFSLDINANYLEVMGNFTENDVSLNSTVPHQLSLYVSTVIPKQDDTSKAASPIVTATPTYHIDNNRAKQIIPINQSSSDSASTNQDTISLESTTLNTDTEAIKLNPGTTSFLTSTVETNDKVLSGSVDLPEHSVKPSAVSITTGSTPHTRTTFNWKPYASLASKWVDFTSFTTTTTEVTETTLTDETESEDILLAVEHEGTTTLITVETIDLTTDQTSSLTTDETTFSTTDETTTSTTSISSSSTTAFNWKPYVPLSIQETANETTLQNDDKENQLLHELVEATSSADTQSHNSNTSLGISETAASIYTADTIPLMEITSSTSLHVPTSNTTVLTTTSTSSVSLKSNIPLIEEISSTAYPITNNDNISTTSSSVNSTAVSETSSTSSTDVNVTSSTNSITTTSSVLLSSTTTGATTTFNWKPFIPPNPGSQTSNEPSSTTATSIATEAAATTTNAASTTASTTSHKSHHRKGHGTAVRRMSSQSVAGILLITLTIAISCTATAVFTIQRYRRQRMLDDSVALMSSRRSHGRVYYYDTSI